MTDSQLNLKPFDPKKVYNPGVKPEWNLAELVLDQEPKLNLVKGNSVYEILNFLDNENAVYGVGSVMRSLNNVLDCASNIEVYDKKLPDDSYLSDSFNKKFPHKQFNQAHCLNYKGKFSNISSDVKNALMERSNYRLFENNYSTKHMTANTNITFHFHEEKFKESIEGSYLPKPINLSVK